MSISLVAGLGNPGREYESTRHNLGWVVLDALAKKHKLSWKHAAQFQAEVARWDLSGGRTRLRRARPEREKWSHAGQSRRILRDTHKKP